MWGHSENNCSSCHEVDDLASAMEGLNQKEIAGMLGTLDQISDEMVPFSGTEEEVEQLSLYLTSPKQKAEGAQTQSEGRKVFDNHCSSCHAAEEMPDKFAGMDRAEVVDLLGRLDEINDEMPPFSGTPEEKEALADYLETLKGSQQ